jgi:hypothetical protein
MRHKTYHWSGMSLSRSHQLAGPYVLLEFPSRCCCVSCNEFSSSVFLKVIYERELRSVRLKGNVCISTPYRKRMWMWTAHSSICCSCQSLVLFRHWPLCLLKERQSWLLRSLCRKNHTKAVTSIIKDRSLFLWTIAKRSVLVFLCHCHFVDLECRALLLLL